MKKFDTLTFPAVLRHTRQVVNPGRLQAPMAACALRQILLISLAFSERNNQPKTLSAKFCTGYCRLEKMTS